MPLPCPVCIDPELREAVDEALDARTSFRDLASRFGGTKDTFLRRRSPRLTRQRARRRCGVVGRRPPPSSRLRPLVTAGPC